MYLFALFDCFSSCARQRTSGSQNMLEGDGEQEGVYEREKTEPGMHVWRESERLVFCFYACFCKSVFCVII